jgi:hypothetical protein
MPIFGAIIGGGLGLLGSSMQADAARDAAAASANAQIKAARIAAEEARFRPIGVTTRFGQSQFTMGKDGRLKSAGYTVSPELRAYQDRLMGMAGGAGIDYINQAPGMYAPLTGASERLFNLGERYLAESPEQVAQRYMTSQLDILAPQRERQLAALRNEQFQAGRSGLSVGATGTRPGGGAGLAATNPEMEAYYNAIAQQDARLAAQAQEEGQRQLAFGTTLFGTGADLLGNYQRGLVGSLAPFQGYLGAAGDIESLGQQSLSLGSSLGGGNTASAQALLTGGTNAAQTMQAANALNPTASFLQGLSTNQDFTSALTSGAQNLFSRPSYSSFNENVPGNFPTTYFTPNPNARNQGYGYY